MKLTFIQDWIDFTETNKHIFSQYMYPNVLSLPEKHMFMAPYLDGYICIFNNGISKLYYQIVFIGDGINVTGPIKFIVKYNDGYSPSVAQINKTFTCPIALYTTVTNHQNIIDKTTIGDIINYIPYKGGEEDRLAQEFKILKCASLGDSDPLVVFQVCMLQQRLQKGEFVVCCIDFGIWRCSSFGHIFYVVTNDDVFALSLRSGQLMITSIRGKEPGRPFTFKDKVIIRNPFRNINLN